MRATIFFLTFVVFSATVVWRVDQIMFGDKLAWGEAQSRAQMSSISHALETEVRSLRDLLLLSFTEVELGKKDFSSNRPYSQFQMMSKLLPPNLKDDRKDWQVVSTFFQENSATKKWATPYITLALKSVKESAIKGENVHIYSLMDPQRRPYLLLLTRGGANWYAGLLNSGVFQGLMDRQKGQASTVFVVNLNGQALGHTTSEYVGSLLTEDPLVSELIKASVGSGFGLFKDLKGEAIQGLYEQVENTNLYSVITTPVGVLAGDRSAIRWQLILMGAGLALVGLAIFVFSDRGGSFPRSLRSETPPLVTPAAPVPATVTSTEVASGAEKMKAYTQVASSLSHELRSPLTSILGHTQLVLNQVSDAQAQNHLRQIEHEAREAREIIQKLMIFAGEDKVPTQKIGLETVVNKALKRVEGKLIFKGIKLNKSIDSVPQFTMAGDLLVKAIENLLMNSIEAMERAPKKELNVKLEVQGSGINLTISDTGEGIAAKDLSQVFDPFFTTRSGSNHVGLGLSTALGIFKEAFAEVKIDSEKGQGTTVTVTFKPQEALINAAAATETPANPLRAPSQPVTPLPVEEKTRALESEPKAAELKNEFPLDPLLVDNTIERLIEDDLPDMPPPPPEVLAKKNISPELDIIEPAPEPVFSAKIDKPNISVKKKASRLDELTVTVRRPGDRL